MDAQQDEEEDTRAHSEGAPQTVVNQREVCGNTARAYAIAQQKHEVARPAMYSRYVEDFVAFGPWLLAIIPLHHG